MLELCSDGQQPVRRHVLLPSHQSSLPEEDVEYLKRKGAFSVPQSETCKMLLRSYFHHIHPLLPVVDATSIMPLLADGQATRFNLLLLWSVFFSAMTFVPATCWENERYASRKQMRDAMYLRAKCMYETSGETDRTVLLQSAILLSFYHSEKDLHTQPWYWSGIAISHCQIMGLHRPPAMTQDRSSTGSRQRSIWRRLWWCCFFRDRWLSLTLGRPLRIDLLDCTVAMPIAADLLVDIADMPGTLAATYIPEDWSQLAQDWVLLMQVSKLLGEVLALSFRPNARKPLSEEVKALETAILACPVERGGEFRKSSSTIFSWCHIQLHYQYVSRISPSN